MNHFDLSARTRLSPATRRTLLLATLSLSVLLAIATPVRFDAGSVVPHSGAAMAHDSDGHDNSGRGSGDGRHGGGDDAGDHDAHDNSGPGNGDDDHDNSGPGHGGDDNDDDANNGRHGNDDVADGPDDDDGTPDQGPGD